MKYVYYSDGYKYQTEEDFTIETGVIPEKPCSNKWMTMDMFGRLTIYSGYAWDGPSGPTFDTKNFMRGSLVHDALYQLMGEGQLTLENAKEPADRLLQSLCIEDGMTKLRAWWVYQGVHIFGGNAAEDPDEPVLRAP